MSEVLGITFDDEKHTYTDFGLRIKKVTLSFPKVKENMFDLPGADGYIDMTDYFGTHYENRTLTIECDIEDKNYSNWAAKISAVSNYLHGKKRNLVLDWDNGYYYTGRGTVETDKDNRVYSSIILSFGCEPYKYEKYSSIGDWLWDPFDLDDGVIREYGDLEVNGTLNLTVIGSSMATVPEIIVSAAMNVEYEGEIYELSEGVNYIPDIEIKEGEHTMTFTGNGTVTVSYRGGSL